MAVGWYLRFSLSYRDVEELLAERGLSVDHVTVWRYWNLSKTAGSLAVRWSSGRCFIVGKRYVSQSADGSNLLHRSVCWTRTLPRRREVDALTGA